MTGINHKQAQRYLRAAADGLIRENQHALLDAHLRECDSCRAEAEELKALDARLKKNFQARWDANDGPSRNVIATIRSRSRRIIMTNRINTGLKTALGIAVLFLLIVSFNPVFRQVREYSERNNAVSSTPSHASEPPATDPLTFTLTVKEAERLAGFDVLEPTYLPEGYIFQGAGYDPQTQKVALTYASPFVDPFGEGRVNIYQQRGDVPRQTDNLPPHVTPVPVGDVTGEFSRGVWIYESGATTPRWDGSADYYSLSWQKNGTSFMVDSIGGEGVPPIQLNGLSAIAESLKHMTTQTAQQIPLIATDKSNGEWIAFVGSKLVPGKDDPAALSEMFNVYMIHPDGTGLINLSNCEDNSGCLFENLQWSYDGKHLAVLQNVNDKKIVARLTQYGGGETMKPFTDPDNFGYSWSPSSYKIVFADASGGNYDIYTVYMDGRNDPELRQLTNDSAQDAGFVWSPDGRQIAFERFDGNQLSVYIMNEDGSNQREVGRGMGKVNLRWSLDGTSIYASSGNNSWLDCETCVHKPGIYRIYLNGSVQIHQIYYEQDGKKIDGWYLYDTPQNSLYFARLDHSAFLNFRGTWMQTDGNSVQELGASDPHQTCKTTTGNILGEHISPNERFSVITDFCAGGFDLYLADHETQTPGQKPVHLIRLPLYAIGGGGDGAYLPIEWSPDGRWLVYDDGIGDTFLLNLERVLQDPSTKPTLLRLYPNQPEPTGLMDLSIGDLSVFDFNLAWQPRP